MGKPYQLFCRETPLEGGRLSIQVYIHRHTACNSVYPRLYSYYKVKKLGIGVTVDFDKLSTLEKINQKDNGFYIKKFVVKVLGSWNLPVENLNQLCCAAPTNLLSFPSSPCWCCPLWGFVCITSYANIQFSNRPQTNWFERMFLAHAQHLQSEGNKRTK